MHILKNGIRFVSFTFEEIGKFSLKKKLLRLTMIEKLVARHFELVISITMTHDS